MKLNQLQMAGRANLKSRSSASVVSVPAHCKSKRAANSRKTKKRGRPAKKQTKLIRSATVVTPNKPKTSPNRQLSSSNSASTSSPTYSYAEVARSAGSRPIGVPIQISPLIRVVHAPIVDDPKIRSPSKSVGQRKSGVEAQPTHLERPRYSGLASNSENDFSSHLYLIYYTFYVELLGRLNCGDEMMLLGSQSQQLKHQLLHQSLLLRVTLRQFQLPEQTFRFKFQLALLQHCQLQLFKARLCNGFKEIGWQRQLRQWQRAPCLQCLS